LWPRTSILDCYSVLSNIFLQIQDFSFSLTSYIEFNIIHVYEKSFFVMYKIKSVLTLKRMM
jgi:hypothetical protein